jgi:site-specific DNA-methyltransferase (adenine-specific)
MLHATPLPAIVVPEGRQRREFDEQQIRDLANDIGRNGLIHPIVLRDDGKTLAAGERRLRALSLLHTPFYCGGIVFDPGFAPTLRLHDCSPLELEEIELHENILRVNLTWQERNDAIARLHRLRSAQNPQQTISETAAEVQGGEAAGAQITRVSDALIIAQHLDDPEIAAAKNEKEALNLIKRKMAKDFIGALARTVPKSKHTLLAGSIHDLMPELPEGRFDVILTDPPYGIDAHSMPPMSGSNSGIVHEYEDTYANALRIYQTIALEGLRVTRDRAHAYIFLDFKMWEAVSVAFKIAGWTVWPRPLIWVKHGGMLGDSLHGPRRAYEMILFASKGDKPTLEVRTDVIQVPLAASLRHPAEKPVGLYEDLLRRSITPGSQILDPCCGSGTIFPAANRLGAIATGIELSQQFVDLSATRLGEELK